MSDQGSLDKKSRLVAFLDELIAEADQGIDPEQARSLAEVQAYLRGERAPSSARRGSGETPRCDELKAELLKKYPDPAETKLLYYMEAAESWGQLARELEIEADELDLAAVSLAREVSEKKSASFIEGSGLLAGLPEANELAAQIRKSRSSEQDCRHLLNELLARIFRDGGQRQSQFATLRDAAEEADKLVAGYIASATKATHG